MMQEGGQRIATAEGAMLADPASLGNLLEAAGVALFDPEFWALRGELSDVVTGRGSAWFIGTAPRAWVLRHSRRGGLIARFVRDRYVWTGEPRVRAFAEWRLLRELVGRNLPVPKPVAARYQRRGLTYRCDLIVQRIVDAEALSAVLARGPLGEGVWREVGVAIARLHAAGADHADLNAHNILVGRGVSVIDFDRGRLRAPGPWASQNLARLQRSLRKLAHYREREWQWLLDGYASV